MIEGAREGSTARAFDPEMSFGGEPGCRLGPAQFPQGLQIGTVAGAHESPGGIEPQLGSRCARHLGSEPGVQLTG